MATLKSINANATGANTLHARIVRLLDELRDERGRAFAVAAAGGYYVGDKDINMRSLFDVIGEIEGNIGTENEIRRELEAFAKLAGSTWTPEEAARHG